jgi:hypothetical protein
VTEPLEGTPARSKTGFSTPLGHSFPPRSMIAVSAGAFTQRRSGYRRA